MKAHVKSKPGDVVEIGGCLCLIVMDRGGLLRNVFLEGPEAGMLGGLTGDNLLDYTVEFNLPDLLNQTRGLE